MAKTPKKQVDRRRNRARYERCSFSVKPEIRAQLDIIAGSLYGSNRSAAIERGLELLFKEVNSGT